MKPDVLRRLFTFVIAVGAASLLLASLVGVAAAAPGGRGRSAENHEDVGAPSADNSRPGWGCGDANHVHTGPPGLGPNAVSPCPSTTPTPTSIHLVVSAPATATAGTAVNFTVTAEDQENSTVTSFADTVHFTSSDAAAALAADSTLTNGVGTFSAILRTLGNQTITATDRANSAITGTSNPIAVVAQATTHFAVSAPTGWGAGMVLTFTVRALDASNNTVNSFSDTVHFTSSDPAATLPADSTLTNGTGTFTAILRTAGNQTITATDTANSLINGTSNAIAIGAAQPAHFALTAPASATAGIAFTFTVTVQDQFNNTVTFYPGTVHFTSSDPAATLPADGHLPTSGVGTFSATLHTTGTQTITATDTVITTLTGTSGPILVTP